ncbi:EXTERNAL ALTERNATIVE NAD(P)H-UBIQUINONE OXIDOREDUCTASE B2 MITOCHONDRIAL-RELATED [Salix purpurea]|uniref:NADH:ubiquinone reductase (non-electrogenic) n=1 Tax=Salix purpurea TaxID=77065 RepID=A0A9Q1AFX9_SALPP|nr:EXTERNAL ALTERNATIVE NAD(P)H-UBIQUINONE OXIDOREDUCTASE B2 MITOCHONDRIAL-RELATED [Salix purpurea]
MNSLSLLKRASRYFDDYPSLAKLLVVCTISGGGYVAYADANGTGGSPPVLEEIKKKKVVVLGTGWAGTSFLKKLDNPSYDVQVISPRNYFAFTPLLPSVTCGTVEARSIVEPIRSIVRKKSIDVKYWEAECFKIDAENKKVHSMGGRPNTFNTPGVVENCNFLKEVEDAQQIRQSVINSFEKASLPTLSDEERKRILHFVIVGGGPTGVEFAAELHDFVNEDLVKLYPAAKDFVKITLLEASDHILNMFDKRITDFAESKFQRDGIDMKLGSMVVKVSDKEISTKVRGNSGEITTIPYGMVVWSTGIGTHPVIRDFMQKIGQSNRRALATDEWLRVEGCGSIYALGDCATINQRKVMEDIAAIFKKADKDNSGTLTVKEFREVIKDICERYPQWAKGDVAKEAIELNIEEFKKALSEVDSQMKNHPATAQVAAQQGTYLAKCFNRMEEAEKNPEGPIRFREEGRHRFRPFRYKHLGQFAPLGGEQAAAQLPGDWVSIGRSSQWLWYSVYASKLVSWRTRVLVVSDWTRRFVFGRDSSRI